MLSYWVEFAGTFTPKRKSQVGRNRSLIGKAHEAKEARRTLLGLRPGHDADVTVNFLAYTTTLKNLASSASLRHFFFALKTNRLAAVLG
jgi:hypothetical protein